MHAYEYVKDELGFDLSGRTKWPVIINVVWFQNGAYGYFEPSKFGDNYVRDLYQSGFFGQH
jgi:hypothetical protein